MLEVNDFNSVRISLASPEHIKSLSHGEVTKPETINYRTLRPEKDGLFCERIFGPTKDWECYCGKYKRMRNKGIVCDKCGVEVARAKVRRERMGHIELAAPVAHIWFVKGTPSRIGLLLDKSPRDLERVLYFVSYIVTQVDEQAKARALSQLEEDSRLRKAQLQQKAEEAVNQINARLATELEEPEKKRQRTRQALWRDAASQLRRLAQELLEEVPPPLVARLRQLVRGAVKEGPHVLPSRLIDLLAGEKQARPERLEELVEALGKLVEETRAQQADIDLRYSAQRDQKLQAAEQDIAEVQRKLPEETTQEEERWEAQRREIEEIQKGRLLSEGPKDPKDKKAQVTYRELMDKYGEFHLFKAGMGAEALREMLRALDLEALRKQFRDEIATSGSGQRRKKAMKRLRVVEAFRASGNRPEWMILTVLPVLPPDLRPMVQLDGGRFATSDLNDLYRRVINRNNRLKKLVDLGAPEIIIRNEKRMLQEAVDSLIDNGRRGRAVAGTSNHKLKSLSDMLKGKQGRFRQNLLGKRVDYSGRSVIVVGPNLKLHQCGLPRRMALELFKPFVMRRLVERNFAHNIKSAKRIVERMKPEVWDALEEVIQGHPVLLNRAPTLHRLGIQAFEPVLVDGSAIQIHPLVCAAFGADFDGDQMAVHLPLSAAAQEEARTLMMSVYNLMSPASGEPIVSPTLDMVLGCYYLTVIRPGAKGEGKAFSHPDEARLAYELGAVDLHAAIRVRLEQDDGQPPQLVDTSVGRLIFNELLPPHLRNYHETMDKKKLKGLVADCYRMYSTAKTVQLLDDLKQVGFRFATQSGITIAISDIGEKRLIERRDALLAEADRQIDELDKQYRRGLISEEERYTQAIELWNKVRDEVTHVVEGSLDHFGSVYMMTTSGAKGNIQQLAQMAGMRGLMAAPSGRIIELPIRSSFREGLTVLEYFISTHGARKGLADTAIKTADSGYLTRRLIDVAQDVVVQEEGCGTTGGIWLEERGEGGLVETLSERVLGRIAASRVTHPVTGEVIVERNELIDEERARAIEAAGIRSVYVRSVLACETRHGVCRRCYGRSLARGGLVPLGEAVGIIAAESIGEPGTQLTMRTFHTGGVAGVDITSGLPRVEELFEARVPKGQAILSEIDGVVEITRTEGRPHIDDSVESTLITRTGGGRRIRVVSAEVYPYEHLLPEGSEVLVADGETVGAGQVLARRGDEEVRTVVAGRVGLEADKAVVYYEEREEREYEVLPQASIRVANSRRVAAGEFLTEGPANPQDILRIQGREAVQRYLVDEVQRVYRSQGVAINDKHIEVIVRRMLGKVKVESNGDTDLLPGELVGRFTYEDLNNKVLAQGGEPATAQTVLLGVTKAALNTASFLSAASFQETTRVLTEAAVEGRKDYLLGLKENVIIGKLIPAGSGARLRQELALRKAALAASLAAEGPGMDSEAAPQGHEEERAP